MRLDLYLVEKGYFSSRNKARVACDEKAVLVDGKAQKASFEVDDSNIITIDKETDKYVSRGGYKLEAAIREFRLDFKDKTIVDIGASTGGFTDCALQNGAIKVYSVDVGTNQLADKLINDSRVISLEQTNIMDIPYFPEEIDYFIMDVSFVSIEHLLPAISNFLDDNNSLVCLIKPQFEVGKIYMKNGIVKDKSVHIKVLENVNKALAEYNLGIDKLIASPILGGSGNKEFLALIKKNVKTRINFIEACK